MLDILALICVVAAVLLLVVLSVIDLKIRILPNVYVLAFAVCGLVFHGLTQTRYLPPEDVFLGAAIGFGSLWAIRRIANHHYKADTLGLGDVKLMGAAGLWLGTQGILLALTVGAFAGIVHGLAYGLYLARRDNAPLNLSRLAIPAGPGFAVGIAVSAALLLHPFFKDALHVLFS